MAFVDSNETAVEGEDDAGVDFDFVSWIAQNGLEAMKDKLAEHGLTTPANINIQSKAFRALMSDALFLASNGHLVPKLFAAIDAVSDYHDHQPSQNAVPTSPKQQRFIVYVEEEKVMDSIQHQIDELSCIESKTEALNHGLSQSMQRIDQQKSAQIASAANKIAVTFRELLKQMNDIKTTFVNDLRALQSQPKHGVDDDSKEDACRSSLSEYAQKNRDTKAYLEQQLAQCHEKMNTMLNDRRKERKQQIIEIGDQGRAMFDEIASEFEQHQGKVHRLVDDNKNTVVHIGFAVNENKKQKMTRLMSKIGRIVNRQYSANAIYANRGDESDNVDGDSDDALEATMEALRNQMRALHEFSVNVQFIHHDTGVDTKRVPFDRRESYAQFKQRVVTACAGIKPAFLEDLQLGILLPGDKLQYAINDDTAVEFPAFLKQLNAAGAQVLLLAGMYPVQPIVDSIQCTVAGQFVVKLAAQQSIANQSTSNKFCYEVIAENSADLVRFEPNSTTSTTMQIGGLDANQKYAIRVRAHNIFGASPPSEYTEYQSAKPMNQNNEQVKKAASNVRFIFFLCDENYSDTYFFLRPFGVDAAHPFTLLDAKHFVYLCIYEGDTQTDPKPLVFNIISTKMKGALHKEKSKLVKHHDALPKPDTSNHAWTMAKYEDSFFLDFSSSKSAWQLCSKSTHYQNVGAAVMRHVLNYCLRSEIAPLHALRIIFRLYHFLKDAKRNLLPVQQIRSMFITQLASGYRQIKNVRSWKEVSTMLVCLAALWSIESSQLKASSRVIGDVESAKIYQHLIEPQRGSTDNVLLNVKETYGEYLPHFMAKLTAKVASEKQQITKYGYALWYNLFNCIKADPKPSNREKIEKNLYATSALQHLLTICGCDLTFIAYDRPIKLEYFFVRSLLSGKPMVQLLSARMKYDFMVQLLGKISVLSEIYLLLFNFKEGVTVVMGDDAESWFGLVYFVLKACKIPPKKEWHELQSKAEVQKCVELTSDLFCYKIERMNQQAEFAKLYELCNNFPVILSERVRLSIMQNEHLIAEKQFVCFYVDMLRPEMAKDWTASLVKCVRVWLNVHGLRESIFIMENFALHLQTLEAYCGYCLNHDISQFVPAVLDQKLELIVELHLPDTIRRIICSSIRTSWESLTAEERVSVLKTTVFLLQHGLAEAADTILRNVLMQLTA